MTSYYKFIVDEIALERDLSESCAEIARLQSEVATLRAREARLRAAMDDAYEHDQRTLLEHRRESASDVALRALAILDDDGKDGEG